MAREVAIELARYRDIKQYQPKVGDIIIKHGWIFSTVWFGIVNYIDKEGLLHICIRGHPRILFLTSPSEMPSNIHKFNLDEFVNSVTSRYTIMQQEPVTNIPVWYV